MPTDNKKIEKVTAEIHEGEPIFNAHFQCPYCKEWDHLYDVEEDNKTITVVCCDCEKKYKLKIPKFF